MTEITQENVESILKKVLHPEIQMDLYSLGIARVLEIKGNEIQIGIIKPFEGVPNQIVQMMAQSVNQAVKNVFPDSNIRFFSSVMDEKTRQRFFELEHKHWKGL